MSLLSWKLHGNGKTISHGEVVSTDERLSWPRTIGVGLQHIAAMFGATFLVPILTDSQQLQLFSFQVSEHLYSL
jgi:NCS2 family nucleobase:cation symporter-2